MRRININNLEELKQFKMETTGFVSSYGFPYRLDDLTNKGANYTTLVTLAVVFGLVSRNLNQ